ncbi:MAG TPA: P1 family peptidase [Anaerolineales bacterium]
MMTRPRARDLGIPFEGKTGTYNAITDVSGVTVGYATVIEADSARTGVTAIHPRGQENHDPVFAAWFPFNGNGEMTGSAWLEEGGFLEGPIGITNTHSVGVVRDTIIKWQVEQSSIFQGWSCPLVTETADGWLNDINGFFVNSEHVLEALNSAKSGPIAEGNVGGGTGMLCYEFKGGTGTSSRKLPEKLGGWTVAALAQTNFGRRFQLTIAGVPVGQHLKENALWTSGENPFRQDDGSLIVIIATDAPLLPHQLKRLAKRASLGMARTGSLGGNGSGDIFLAFSTANPQAARGDEKGLASIDALSNNYLDPLLFASAYATEEAIINSMIAAEDMIGYRGVSVKALPHDALCELMGQYNRT